MVLRVQNSRVLATGVSPINSQTLVVPNVVRVKSPLGVGCKRELLLVGRSQHVRVTGRQYVKTALPKEDGEPNVDVFI